MSAPKDPSLQCTATAKGTGKRCQQPAIPGGTVCRYHGGSAPQVQEAARLRLQNLVQPAIVVLGRILADPMALEASKLRAVENVLDRSGYPRHHQVDVEQARRSLLERIDSLDDEELAAMLGGEQ